MEFLFSNVLKSLETSCYPEYGHFKRSLKILFMAELCGFLEPIEW